MRVQDFGFRVSGSGLRFQVFVCWVLGFRVFGFRLLVSRFGVQDSGLKISSRQAPSNGPVVLMTVKPSTTARRDGMVQGSGFLIRVWCLGCGVWGLGLVPTFEPVLLVTVTTAPPSIEFSITMICTGLRLKLGFGGQHSRFRVQGLGVWLRGCGLRFRNPYRVLHPHYQHSPPSKGAGFGF